MNDIVRPYNTNSKTKQKQNKSLFFVPIKMLFCFVFFQPCFFFFFWYKIILSQRLIILAWNNLESSYTLVWKERRKRPENLKNVWIKIQGVPENLIPGRIFFFFFFETDPHAIFHIVCNFNFHKPLAFSRSCNYENVKFLTEVTACLAQLVLKKFPCFLNIKSLTDQF